MDADRDVARPSLSYTAIAEKLLAHRLAQPDLSPAAGNDKSALPAAFRRLAEVFALDHAAAAGEPPRAIISVLVGRPGRGHPGRSLAASCSSPRPGC